MAELGEQILIRARLEKEIESLKTSLAICQDERDKYTHWYHDQLDARKQAEADLAKLKATPLIVECDRCGAAVGCCHDPELSHVVVLPCKCEKESHENI